MRGSTKCIVLVAELQDGVLRYRGHGVEQSKGMRKGLIAELGPAAEVINRAALTAERVAKAGIETAVVGIGRNACARGEFAGRHQHGQPDARDHPRRSPPLLWIEQGPWHSPPDREVLHLLPQEFILDDQPGIHDPVGMVGNKLEVNRTCRPAQEESRKA